MKGLGGELPGKRLDLLRVDQVPAAGKSLSKEQGVQIARLKPADGVGQFIFNSQGRATNKGFAGRTRARRRRERARAYLDAVPPPAVA
jgi:hypothetical protein